MWAVTNSDLKMVEGDWGIELPVTISGVTLSENDVFKFTFKQKVNGTTILEKEYTPTQNKVTLEFTEAESALFHIGVYVYSLDWYQSGAFLCNVIPCASFRVVDKA